MHKINWPVVALIIANIIWGATSPIIKYALENIPPYSLAFIRFLIASIILYPFAHRAAKYSDLKDKWLWIYAICGVTLNIIFFFQALERTSSINAPIIASTGPVMILIGSVIFLKERVKKAAIIGTIISLFGVGTIIFEPILETGVSTEITGNLLIIFATLSAVVATMAGRKFLTEKNAITSTFWSCFIGTISFLPFMIWEYQKNPLWLSQLDVRGWTGIIFGAIFSSALAYTIYDWALAKLPAYKTSIFTYIDPVVAIIIAVPLLGEKITLPFILGSILVFVGILIAEKRIHWHPIHKIID